MKVNKEKVNVQSSSLKETTEKDLIALEYSCNKPGRKNDTIKELEQYLFIF